MTVGQLLGNCSSVELSLWQAYLQADSEEREYQRELAQKEAEARQWVNEV